MEPRRLTTTGSIRSARIYRDFARARFRPLFPPRLGTRFTSLRFSESIIAIACLRFLTLGPCFEPERSFLCLYSLITFSDGILISFPRPTPAF